MTLIPNNDRVPVQKLGDPLLVGETYPNGKSLFKVLRIEGYYGDAWIQNVKSGWVCKVHRPALYLMPGGRIELKWDYSTEGHFEA
ncbi:MAG: hypothetical protein ACLTWO_13725 [Blautia massiliensis (ex Durand et al. 2017)]|nr:MAG: hypothetical protein DBX91_06340 [Subdoligranulum variabile]